jgi:hypothetical protein
MSRMGAVPRNDEEAYAGFRGWRVIPPPPNLLPCQSLEDLTCGHLFIEAAPLSIIAEEAVQDRSFRGPNEMK